MNGIINIFKPKGITSHDVVSIMRRTLNMKRIGHTGTLDPNVTGVLPLCIGRATRVSEYLLDIDKEYVGELNLGLCTDTQDKYGKPLKSSSKKVSQDEIYKAFDKFKGHIQQTPPMYSALKHNGKRLYELAREGKVVERKPRDAYIYSLDIISILNNKVTFSVKCSKGTYIRTLCNDIGELLGTYGYMSYLMRIGVGDFNINNSYSIDYIKSLNKEEFKTILMPMDEGLSNIDSLMIEEEYFSKIKNGVMIPLKSSKSEEYNEDTPFKIYCDNLFMGIGNIRTKENKLYLKMYKVLI